MVKLSNSIIRPRTGHECPEGEEDYSFTLTLTSVLDVGDYLTPRSGLLTSGKENQYPLHSRLGRPQDRSGRVQEILFPSEFDPRTVQHIASRCADYAIAANEIYIDKLLFCLSLEMRKCVSNSLMIYNVHIL
jgi:hypothetical protein